MVDRTLERAEQQLNEGNLWRAKEILQGAVRNNSYDVALFEKLGIVLLRMNDLPEAGKFLFLSGIRKPEYEQSINLFLRKYGNKQPNEFLRLFPRKARLEKLSAYPEDVAHTLRAIGLPETLPSRTPTDAFPPRTLHDATFWITCVTIALVALALMIIGFATVMRYIRG